ncbi:Thiol peroxidase [Mannheimia haemolytica]
MNILQAGDKAPKFTLQNQADEPVSLSQFAGKKVLVYFYPKALTPGCTTQACGLRDSKSELDELNVVVLGISTDLPKKLAQFVEKKHLILPYYLTRITKLQKPLVYGAKRNLWEKPMTAFIASVF